MTAEVIVLDRRRMRRDHAEDIAADFLRCVRFFQAPLALLIDGAGEVRVVPRSAIGRDEGYSLVGVYDRSSHLNEIVADILAMETEAA